MLNKKKIKKFVVVVVVKFIVCRDVSHVLIDGFPVMPTGIYMDYSTHFFIRTILYEQRGSNLPKN